MVKNKENAVKGMIEGPVTPELPASVLQNHKDVTVIIDKAAAALLEKNIKIHEGEIFPFFV